MKIMAKDQQLFNDDEIHLTKESGEAHIKDLLTGLEYLDEIFAEQITEQMDDSTMNNSQADGGQGQHYQGAE